MTETIPPWAYRAKLANQPDPFLARSSKGSGTIEYEQASPILGTALHASHDVNPELESRMAISEPDRFYEEDPGTDRFLRSTTHRILPRQSRYEVDLNRPPDTAIYLRPEMAWGQQVWSQKPGDTLRETTLEKWYEYHSLIDAAVQDAIHRFGHAIVLDMHSYNYQRDGETNWRKDEKPVINLGTRHLELDSEGQQLKDWFFDQLSNVTVQGEPCLVEENSVFYGGYLNRRLSRTYGADCLTFSVEFKKVFMDEQTGEIHDDVLEDLLTQFDEIVHRLANQVNAPIRETPREPGAWPPG